MNSKERITGPTPKFFKKVRTIGLALTAISTSILASPVTLPAILVQIAGYLAVAGSVATAISQIATTKEEPDPQNKPQELRRHEGTEGHKE
jgi:hypothetical protein